MVPLDAFEPDHARYGVSEGKIGGVKNPALEINIIRRTGVTVVFCYWHLSTSDNQPV
jgi:hypothetical protein